MAESILKIHTQNGDIPVGYPGLANKPIADKTLSVEGAFADSKAVGDKFKQVKAETDSLKEDIANKLGKDQLTTAVNDALTQAKESGEFDGKDGKTPARGTDYWTEADKAAIVDDVIAALPAAEEVSV